MINFITRGPSADGQTTATGSVAPGASTGSANPSVRPKRFHDTVALDATRVGRVAGRIADEVTAHLVGLMDLR